MGKCFIEFSCVQQDLRRTDKNTVAADAAETVAARFDFGSKWDGLNVYARFQHGPEVYDVPLVDGCATIPHEVMRETGFNVSIFGEDASGARLTSARVFVDVEPTISNDGAPPIPATPSLLQRIDALVHASSENAYNAAESARVAQEANAATVEVDGVDTLPAGSAATVANVGTPQDARLRFGIPKGDKGDKGSGGIPSGGAVGQVVCKTATGEGWADANAHGHDAADITSGTMSADRLPVSSIAKGGTGGTTEQQARDNILAGVPRIDVSDADFDAANRVNVYAMEYDEPTTPNGRMVKFELKRFWLWIDKKIRSVFGFDDLNILPVSNGGTGAASPAGARDYLGAAAADHTHTAEDVGAAAANVGDCITAKESNSTTLTKSRQHIVTNSVVAQKGSSFSVSDDGYIVCNFDGTVILSATSSIKGVGSGDQLQINAGKNGYAFDSAAGKWVNLSVTTTVEVVTSGEKLGVNLVNWTNDRGTTGVTKLSAIRLS